MVGVTDVGGMVGKKTPAKNLAVFFDCLRKNSMAERQSVVLLFGIVRNRS